MVALKCPSCKMVIQLPDVTARDLPIVTCAWCKSTFKAPSRLHARLKETNPALYGVLGIAVVLFLVRLFF